MKTKVLKLDNTSGGDDVELNDAIFGLEPRADLIQRVVVWQLAKRRSGQHKTLTRAEINRTKHRFGKQKGGGTRPSRRPLGSAVRRRRQGDGSGQPQSRIRPAQEGPRPRLRHALSAKAKSGSIVVLDEPSPPRSRPARWPSSSPASASRRC